jgi:hypothetical protein
VNFAEIREIQIKNREIQIKNREIQIKNREIQIIIIKSEKSKYKTGNPNNKY